MARNSQPVTVTLGEMKEAVDARVRSGRYASASEVIRAGLRALDREEKALDDWMRAKIQEALDDPRPSVPADEVFERLWAYHHEQAALDASKG
jgi:antitoxin ParD1/3/4